MADERVTFLTHMHTPWVMDHFQELKRTCGDRHTVFLYHGEESEGLPEPRYCFTLDILHRLGYPLIGDSLYGHVHFPLFAYFFEHCGPEVSHLWFVEYDMRFTGEWSYLFDYFEESDADFISSQIVPYAANPASPWWNMRHPTESIATSDMLRSFNPIYRISAKAIKFLDQAFRDGWEGHNEVTFPTLLYHHGFELLDMGNSLPFGKADAKNFYYSYSFRNINRGLGTMRYRPPFKRAGLLPNTLYHPVKPEEGKGVFHALCYYLKKMLN